jgi:hypothetical protein
MANSLGEELKGKVVIVDAKYCAEGLADRRFLCEDGFGCSPMTHSESIYGKWLVDGEEDKIRGFMVEAFAKEEATPAKK